MAFYTLSTLGESDNQIVFNDPTHSPLFRAIGRSAEFSDIRAFDTLIPQEGGIEDYKTLLGAVNYIIEGKMYPNSQSDYENGLRTLRAVADVDLSQADPLSDIGYVPYVYQEIDQNKQIFVKVLYAQFQETRRLTMPFKLLCKIKTPRIYGTTTRTAGTGASAGIIVGGVGFPTGYPLPYGATTYAINASAVNAGDRGAYPTNITITGPVTNPKFLNSTSGQFIQVNVTMGVSDVLLITYTPNTVSILLNGVSVYGALSSDSTLFLVKSGFNLFQLQGTSIGAGASGIINFLDTWSLA